MLTIEKLELYRSEKERIRDAHVVAQMELEAVDLKMMEARSERVRFGDGVSSKQWEAWHQQKRELRQKILDLRLEKRALAAANKTDSELHTQEDRNTYNARFRAEAHRILGPTIYDLIARAAGEPTP